MLVCDLGPLHLVPRMLIWGSLVLHANCPASLRPWQLAPCQCRYWANQERLPIPFLISHPLDPGWDGGGPAGEPGWMSKRLLAACLRSRLPLLGHIMCQLRPASHLPGCCNLWSCLPRDPLLSAWVHHGPCNLSNCCCIGLEADCTPLATC